MSERIYEYKTSAQLGTYSLKKREEIVRYRDCKHADWFAAVGVGTFRCGVHGWTADKPDGFCAWGER